MINLTITPDTTIKDGQLVIFSPSPTFYDLAEKSGKNALCILLYEMYQLGGSTLVEAQNQQRWRLSFDGDRLYLVRCSNGKRTKRYVSSLRAIATVDYARIMEKCH